MDNVVVTTHYRTAVDSPETAIEHIAVPKTQGESELYINVADSAGYDAKDIKVSTLVDFLRRNYPEVLVE